MNEHAHLYSLFERLCPKTTASSIFYHDINDTSNHKICYNTLRNYIECISAAFFSIYATNEVICCVLRPSLVLPAVILGILQVSSAFALLDVSSALSSLKNLKKYASTRVIITEETYVQHLKLNLCACWKILSNESLKSLSLYVFYVPCSQCPNETCPHNEISNILSTSKCNSNLAYIIQTSGTTGDPKVVQVPHHCIIPNIIHLGSIYDIKQNDVILLCSPLSFDPSIVELFLALVFGATLVIIPDYIRSVPSKLSQVIVDNNITVLQVTPSLMQRFDEHFLKTTLLGKSSPLRVLSFGGEECPSRHKLQQWSSSGNKTQFYNLYGITEISCWATYEKIKLLDSVLSIQIPLGQPLLDTEIEVRNENGEKLHDGEGQLFVGGSKRWCVVNDETWPTDDSPILRPTGDWVVKSIENQIFFQGRKDDIIKHHGRKLSLKTVSLIIEDMPEVVNHALHFDKTNEKLYLFLILNSEFDFQNKVRQDLLKHLWDSVPNLPVIELVPVSFFPITKHGKIDMRKLIKFAKHEWMRKLQDAEIDITNENIAKFVSLLWQDYTNMSEISAADNFILNGGNSVTAVQLSSEIEWNYHASIPLLVDKILNASFQDVCCLIQYHVLRKNKNVNGTKECNLRHESGFSKSVIKLPLLAKTKKQTYSDNSCYNMASRRGLQLFGIQSDIFNSVNVSNNSLKDQDDIFLSLDFKFDFKKCIDATPCVVHFLNKDWLLAFIGSHSGLFCAIDLKNNSLKWKAQLPDRIESSACLSACGRFVLTGCYDHHLYCFNSELGNIEWKIKAGAEIKSSPVVSTDNKAFVGCHDQHLYALNIEDGTTLWKKKIGNGSVFSSPAVLEEQYVCAATLDGLIAMLNQDTGVILWNYNYDKPLFSSPLFVATSIFIGSTDGHMLQFNITGALISRITVSGPIFSSPSLFLRTTNNDQMGIIFGSHDCNVYCFSYNGDLLWKAPCESSVYASPFSFKWQDRNFVAAASSNGTVFIFNQIDGELVCKWKCPGEIFSSPVVLENYLVFGCRDNNLYCLKF